MKDGLGKFGRETGGVCRTTDYHEACCYDGALKILELHVPSTMKKQHSLQSRVLCPCDVFAYLPCLGA